MVDRARKKDTKEEVSAWDLYRRVLNRNDPLDPDMVRNEDYICLFCNGVMTPVAIKPNMKRSPYFRIEGEHDLGCNLEQYEEYQGVKEDYKKRNEQESILVNGKFPCSYPNVLDLSEITKVSDRRKNIASIDSQIPISKTNIIVKSLHLLVDHYITFSLVQYRLLKLYIPEIEVKTYQEVFQRICYRENYYFAQPRIYFGELLYKQKEISDRIIRLYFTEGIWENKKPKETMFIEIDISAWKSYQKQNIIEQIEYSLQERQKENSTLWLFFLGKQDRENYFKFRLIEDDYRLVTLVVDDSLHRERKSSIAIPVNATQKDEALLIEKQKQRKELVNNNLDRIRETARSTTVEIVNKKQSQPVRQELSKQITVKKSDARPFIQEESATIEILKNSQPEITSNTEYALSYPNRDTEEQKIYFSSEIDRYEWTRSSRLKAKQRRSFNKRIFKSTWNFVKNSAKKLLNLLFSLWQNKPKKRNRK